MTKFVENAPGNFRVISILAIVWMALGCLSYIMHVTLSPEAIAALPKGQAELIRTTPSWYYALFGIATWGGLAGAIALLLKRRFAVPLLLISWVAAALQFAYNFLVQDGWRLLGGFSGAIMPFAIVGLGIFFWNYARGAAAKGWIR